MMISSHLLKNVSLTTLKQTTGFFSSKALYTNQKVATNLGLIPKPNFTSNKTRTELTRKNPIFTFSDHICKRSFHQSSTLNDDPTHFDKATYAALNGIPEEAVRRKAKIWREDRRPSQQGSGKTGLWTVNFIPDKITTEATPLMGWIGGDDAMQTIRLRFETRDEAITWATENGFDYELETDVDPHTPEITPKSYADNFKYVTPKDPFDV